MLHVPTLKGCKKSLIDNSSSSEKQPSHLIVCGVWRAIDLSGENPTERGTNVWQKGRSQCLNSVVWYSAGYASAGFEALEVWRSTDV